METKASMQVLNRITRFFSEILWRTRVEKRTRSLLLRCDLCCWTKSSLLLVATDLSLSSEPSMKCTMKTKWIRRNSNNSTQWIDNPGYSFHTESLKPWCHCAFQAAQLKQNFEREEQTSRFFHLVFRMTELTELRWDKSCLRELRHSIPLNWTQSQFGGDNSPSRKNNNMK